eukprot:11249260-Ditylum_brightwellii.AAC.1
MNAQTHTRVPEPYISQYYQHYLETSLYDRVANKDVITSDLLALNYPVGSEHGRNGNNISQATAPAIFEIKSIHVGEILKLATQQV